MHERLCQNFLCTAMHGVAVIQGKHLSYASTLVKDAYIVHRVLQPASTMPGT